VFENLDSFVSKEGKFPVTGKYMMQGGNPEIM